MSKISKKNRQTIITLIFIVLFVLQLYFWVKNPLKSGRDFFLIWTSIFLGSQIYALFADRLFSDMSDLCDYVLQFNRELIDEIRNKANVKVKRIRV